MDSAPIVQPRAGTAAANSNGSLRRYAYPSDLFEAPQEPDSLSGEVGADGPSDWWLVYTKSRQEKRLSSQLAEMGVSHYLPVHPREAVTRGRVRLVEEPLFSGYLFLRGCDDARRAALTTNRISATYPVTEPERLEVELAQIAKSIATGARLDLEAGFEPGEWVRVKGGPHEGLEGTVLHRKSKTRLMLSVNFLQQGASFEIHDSLLERVSPPPAADRSRVEIVGRRGL